MFPILARLAFRIAVTSSLRPTCSLLHTNVLKPAKSAVKRLVSKQTSGSPLDDSWSVVAYNLSEGLRIEKVHTLLNSLSEYKIRELPQDLNDEAVVLTPTTRKSAHKDQPLNDIFLFREGAIVFWGVGHTRQKSLLHELSSLKVEPHSADMMKDEMEHLGYSLVNSNERSRLNRDIIQLAISQDPNDVIADQFAFSHAVAQSVKLGIWETILDNYIESIGWVTACMKSGSPIGLSRKDVFQKTGEIYELKHRILSSELLDLPDVYWDRHNQEVLFLSLTSFLNIRRRTSVMNEKLNNCCELMNLLASHMNDRHHLRLEWMIILLITVEVLFEIAKFL